MYSLFFFSSLLRYSFGMPAKALIPALFALGLVLQWLMLRFAKGRKRFLPAFLFLAVVVLCETVGRLGNGLAAILIVSFTWALLLGMLLMLAAHSACRRVKKA